jgi:hypothetical protein
MKRRAGRDEAKRIIERQDEQAEKLLGMPPLGEGDEDWTERWGRRIGRVIGFALAAFLLWHLVSTYVLTP